MNLMSYNTASRLLEAALREAGLSPHPKYLIGRMFRFASQFGSHHQILVGTITALNVSDEGGLELIVSNTRFWEAPLVSIRKVEEVWGAYAPDTKSAGSNGFFPGQMQIYDER